MNQKKVLEKVLIIDFGSQFTQLIARKVREVGVYSEIINFDQLSLNLNNLKNTTIKEPKIQETSTLKLFSCIKVNILKYDECKINFKEEIIKLFSRSFYIFVYIKFK